MTCLCNTHFSHPKLKCCFPYSHCLPMWKCVGRTSSHSLALCWHENWRDASASACFVPHCVGRHRRPGAWHSSSWTTEGPRSTLQASLSCSSGLNTHKSFFPDLWLTLMGSFISILIGGHGKGAYSPHFFWRNLPSLKPSTTSTIQITFSPSLSYFILWLPSAALPH